MAKVIVSVVRVRELFAYDPRTGIFMWRVCPGRKFLVGKIAGRIKRDGYSYIGIDGRYYLAHRLVWAWMTGSWPRDQIDHINGIRDDNRFANLREATPLMNMQNRHGATKNKSGFLGVFRRNKKFMTKIRVNGKQIYLGIFVTPEEAHVAYLTAKRKLHPGWSG